MQEIKTGLRYKNTLNNTYQEVVKIEDHFFLGDHVNGKLVTSKVIETGREVHFSQTRLQRLLTTIFQAQN